MIIKDTQYDRRILAVEQDGSYQLLEVSDVEGKYQSSNYHAEVPIKWQVGFISDEEFENRLSNRYEKISDE